MSTDVVDPVGNGHAPMRAENPLVAHDRHLRDVLAAEVEDLNAILEEEIAIRRELEALLEASKLRERRIARAVAILIDEPAPAASKPAPKPKVKAHDKWEVSEPTIERVWDGYRQYVAKHGNDPITRTVLGAWMTENGQGIGGETIRKAFDALRERELIRMAGTTRGGGKLWALMPEGDADAS